jgi:class 3 adenylate cyclase
VFQTKLSFGSGVAFLVTGLVFTSLLGMLGSLLWDYIPYWPAFMLANLAALYFGWWGIVLTALMPLGTSLIFHDSEPGAFVVVGLVQVAVVLGLVNVLRVDPGVRSHADKAKLVGISIVASVVGASLAWLIQTWTNQSVIDYPHYVFAWVLENITPVVFPGLWLHRVISASYEPFSSSDNKKPVTWMRRSLEYAIPWMATLIVVSAMFVVLLLNQVGDGDFYERFRAQASDQPALRVIALVLSLAILYALGSAVKNAKQSWALVEAVRRHMPNQRLSELLTGGAAIPTEQRLVTVMFTDLRGFTETSAQFEPADLVVWLNTYFTHMGSVIERHGGAIDKFIGDGIMVVFGLQSPDAQARRALLCALDMLDEIELWKQASVARGYPAVDMGIGIHSGIVTAGEIGSPLRKQYTVIGSVVNVSARLESASKGVPETALPIVMSQEAVKHCGLLVHPKRGDIVEEIAVTLKGVVDVDRAWAVRRAAVGDVRAAMQGALEAVRLG